MKVLIVDDIAANITVLRAILDDRGFDVFIAFSGEIALKMLISRIMGDKSTRSKKY